MVDHTADVLAFLESLAEIPREQHIAWARERLADRPHLLEEVLACIPFLSTGDSPKRIGAGGMDLEHLLDLSGERIGGRYRLQSITGCGGIGVVYRSHDDELDRDVAIKILNPVFLRSPVAQERFARESTSAASLEHENIVRVYDSGVDDGLRYSVMELLPEGRSLRGLRFDVLEAAELIAQVCHGLQHSHDAGIVHRDIKPGNILLTADGTPKIADFGLAQDERFAVDRLTRTGELAGTPYYMSPEQVARRQTPIDRRTDVYSAGAVLYELLTNKPPHDGQTSLEVFAKIRDEIPRQLGKHVPSDIATICLKALRKSPAERYQSAAELAGDLERFLRSEPILAQPEPLRRRLMRGVKKHPMLTGITVATLVLGGLWFRNYETPYEGSVLQKNNLRRWEEHQQHYLELLSDEPIYTDDKEPREDH